MREIRVEGMTCGHCAAAVEKAVAAADPAARVQVDLQAGLVRVEGGGAGEAELAAAIRDAGYTPAA